jgi:hypothetical protein
MNDSTVTNETPNNSELNTTAMPTDEQYKEVVMEYLNDKGHLKSPKVVILPSYKKSKGPQSEISITIRGYESMGEICSAGQYVVVELPARAEGSHLAYLLIQFDVNKAAQAFAKRLRRGKNQVLIVGEDCIRIVEIRPNPNRAAVSELILTDPDNLELIDEWSRNIVSHIGQDMTNGEVEYFELLPSESHAALADKLQQNYRSAVRAARHMPTINQPVNPSGTVQIEVAPQN